MARRSLSVSSEGAVDCKHHNGVKSTKTRRCCGGKLITRTRIDCSKIHIAYAETECIAKVCSGYENK